MRMIALVLASCLAASGCVNKGPAKPVPTPVVVVAEKKPTAQEKKDWKRLTRDCEDVKLPDDAHERRVEDVATDLALARKKALEECTKRMRAIRSQKEASK